MFPFADPRGGNVGPLGPQVVKHDRLVSALDQARTDLNARRAGERLAFLQARLAELESRALAASDPGLWMQIGSERRRLDLADRWLQAERDGSTPLRS